MRDQAKRLLHLGIGEIAAGFLFIFVFLNLGSRWGSGTSSNFGLVLLVFLLMQGGSYWLIRYRHLKKRTSINRKVVRGFVWLRRLNLLFGAASLIGILFFFDNLTDLLFGTFLYLFSVIEYINYYEYRLSYGVSGFNLFELRRHGLKRSSLHRLIR